MKRESDDLRGMKRESGYGAGPPLKRARREDEQEEGEVAEEGSKPTTNHFFENARKVNGLSIKGLAAAIPTVSGVDLIAKAQTVAKKAPFQLKGKANANIGVENGPRGIPGADAASGSGAIDSSAPVASSSRASQFKSPIDVDEERSASIKPIINAFPDKTSSSGRLSGPESLHPGAPTTPPRRDLSESGYHNGHNHDDRRERRSPPRTHSSHASSRPRDEGESHKHRLRSSRDYEDDINDKDGDRDRRRSSHRRHSQDRDRKPRHSRTGSQAESDDRQYTDRGEDVRKDGKTIEKGNYIGRARPPSNDDSVRHSREGRRSDHPTREDRDRDRGSHDSRSAQRSPYDSRDYRHDRGPPPSGYDDRRYEPRDRSYYPDREPRYQDYDRSPPRRSQDKRRSDADYRYDQERYSRDSGPSRQSSYRDDRFYDSRYEEPPRTEYFYQAPPRVDARHAEHADYGYGRNYRSYESYGRGGYGPYTPPPQRHWPSRGDSPPGHRAPRPLSPPRHKSSDKQRQSAAERERQMEKTSTPPPREVPRREVTFAQDLPGAPAIVIAEPFTLNVKTSFDTAGPVTPSAPPKRRPLLGCSPITHYRPLEQVGEGTFGVVTRAEVRVAPDYQSDDTTRPRVAVGDFVALKKVVFHNEKDGMPITALREIRILKALNHPNIVPVLDMAYKAGNAKELERGETFMVFPYMEHDLAGLLEDPGRNLPISLIKLWSMQLLEGTLYLHVNSILHRDLKAANLLINNKGILMIADFGLARSLDLEDRDRNYTGEVVTRWYRPPELCLGSRKYGTPVDMWGVGCIIAEMCLKKPIFPGTSEIDQCHRIFETCGTPTDENMPEWRSLPGCADMPDWTAESQYRARRLQNKWDQLFINAGGLGLTKLIDFLLVLDPAKRLTAKEALQDKWFWTEPYPALPGTAAIPSFPDSHEADAKRNAAKRAKAAQANPARGHPGAGQAAAPAAVPLQNPYIQGGMAPVPFQPAPPTAGYTNAFGLPAPGHYGGAPGQHYSRPAASYSQAMPNGFYGYPQPQQQHMYNEPPQPPYPEQAARDDRRAPAAHEHRAPSLPPARIRDKHDTRTLRDDDLATTVRSGRGNVEEELKY